MNMLCVEFSEDVLVKDKWDWDKWKVAIVRSLRVGWGMKEVVPASERCPLLGLCRCDIARSGRVLQQRVEPASVPALPRRLEVSGPDIPQEVLAAVKDGRALAPLAFKGVFAVYHLKIEFQSFNHSFSHHWFKVFLRLFQHFPFSVIFFWRLQSLFSHIACPNAYLSFLVDKISTQELSLQIVLSFARTTA